MPQWVVDMTVFETGREKFYAVLAFCFGIILMLGGKDVYEYLTIERGTPNQITAAFFVEKETHPGDVVTLRVDRNKVRDCPLTVSNIWVNRTGDQVNGPVTAGGGAGIGNEIISVKMEIPHTISPGEEWAYLPKLYYKCSDQTYLVPQPPAWIKVVE